MAHPSFARGPAGNPTKLSVLPTCASGQGSKLGPKRHWFIAGRAAFAQFPGVSAPGCGSVAGVEVESRGRRGKARGGLGVRPVSV